MSHKHAITSVLVLMWACSSVHAQASVATGDGARFFLGILRQYLQIQTPTPTTTIQPPAKTATAEQSLQEYLVKHCGACHSGTGRVVRRFDVSELNKLKTNDLLDTKAPLESPIWTKVNSRKMPPPGAAPLTGAERSELAALLRGLVGHEGGQVVRDPPIQGVLTIQQYVEQNADLAKFAAWAKQSGVWDEVPTIGSYTIFIPTNKAVEDLGPKNQQFLLAPTNTDDLHTVILNHGVALGKYRVQDLKQLRSVWTLITEVAISESRGDLLVADARITTADVECSNGVVHVIDKILIPPSVLEKLFHTSTWYFPNVEMVVVPRGQFQMGAPEGEVGRYPNDGPQHPVELSPFEMSVCEITRLQFEKVLIDPSDTNMPGRRQEPNGDPVQMVPWFQAVEFCNKMSERERVPPYFVLSNRREERGNEVYDVAIPDPTGCGFRLPTEAEWEYACRAGSRGRFCFGDDKEQINDYAWYRDNSATQRTNPVKELKPNAFGLYDMHGNVSEWCQDWYEPNYSTSQLVKDPLGPATGQMRVVRGGNYMWDWQDCRSAARYPARSHQPGFRARSVGFRVARYLPPEKSGEGGFAGAK